MAEDKLFRRQHQLILVILLLLAAGAWWLLLFAQPPSAGGMTGITMGLSAPVFLAVWIVMMVAMMFPTAAPMILMFARVGDARQARGSAFVPTWAFVGAYLAVWASLGVAAYVLALGAQAVGESSPWVTANATRIGGVAILLAGVYQLSPLKQACLTKCRSPLSFITQSWREGYRGALRMGVEHGLYCLGCCWLLFVILFPLGMMNVAAMAVITLIIFIEKSTPIGLATSRLAAVLLVGYGLLVVFIPEALPVGQAAVMDGMSGM